MGKMNSSELREIATKIWWAGTHAVIGDACVRRALTKYPITKPHKIIAVGKAAVPMAAAALEHFGADVPALAFTKYGHDDWPGTGAGEPLHALQIHQSGHPIVDANSLASGELLNSTIAEMGADQSLLLLVSGGASSIVEVPIAGCDLEELREKNAALLASGLDIHAINAQRKQLSRIKGGKLLSGFPGSRVGVLAISDVSGDDIGVIGSGLGDCADQLNFQYEARIIASNALARAAAAECARGLGFDIVAEAEAMHGDIDEVAKRLGQAIRAQNPGVAIYGGEPTVKLPQNPGQGGRNQALALALAREIEGRDDLCVLVAGTDGTDGPTEAAGGIVDGGSWLAKAGGAKAGGAKALERADSGTWLQASGERFVTGPTGTNVMDLLIVVRRG